MSRVRDKTEATERRIKLLSQASRGRIIPDYGQDPVRWDDPMLQRLYRDGHVKLVMLDRTGAFVGGTRTVRSFEITPFGQRWLEAQQVRVVDRQPVLDSAAKGRLRLWRQSQRDDAANQARRERDRRLEQRRADARRESLAQGLMSRALGHTNIRLAQHVIDTGWLTEAESMTEQGHGLFRLSARLSTLVKEAFEAEQAAAGNRYIPWPEIPEVVSGFSTVRVMTGVPISKRLYQYLTDDRAGGTYTLQTVKRHDGGAVLCTFKTPIKRDDENDLLPDDDQTRFRAIMLATNHVVPMGLMMELR